MKTTKVTINIYIYIYIKQMKKYIIIIFEKKHYYKLV